MMYILNILSILNILILLLATKLIEKIPDHKEYHQIFYKNENKNNDETITNKYSTTKNFRELKHYWDEISYYRTFKNVSQIIQDYKTGWFLQYVLAKSKNYESNYNVEVVNCLNPDLQLKDSESAIKN